jgi:hypothetical protein
VEQTQSVSERQYMYVSSASNVFQRIKQHKANCSSCTSRQSLCDLCIFQQLEKTSNWIPRKSITQMLPMFQTLLSVLGSWLCRTSIAHLSALLLHAPGSGEVHDRRWPGSALDHIRTVLANCAKCLLVNDEMFLDTALPDI